MSDFGAVLSTIMGNNPNASVEKKANLVKYKSPTTNSYTKCVKSMGDLPKNFVDIVLKATDPFDKESFEVKAHRTDVFEEVDGIRTKKGERVVTVKGTYQFVLFAHLKTIEVIIETIPYGEV